MERGGIRAKTIVASMAMVGGFGIAILGGLIWSLLVAANLSLSPRFPWSIPITGGLLFLGWRVVILHRWNLPDIDENPLAIPHNSGRARDYGLGGLIGIAGFLAVAELIERLELPVSALHTGATQSPLLSLTYFAMASLVAALCEEAGLRGWMQSGLSVVLGRPSALAIVAVCFAAIHAANPALIELFPIYMLLSLAFSTLVSLSGSIWPAVAGHALANVLSYGVLLLAPGVS
jgi:membrane protease YdiL (CAAX protease family)